MSVGEKKTQNTQHAFLVAWGWFAEHTDYLTITIPSLIVGTYGGGTGLPTQCECLEMLGAYGKDKVYKLAEIVAATVLAGELLLAVAISSPD